MENLVLTRKGSEVYAGTKKLTINMQASKGPNNEVVKIEGLEHSNGKKWLSLSLLKEGVNEVECHAKVETSQVYKTATAKVVELDYRLTPEETAQVEALNAQLKVIIDAAKARFVPRPRIDLDPTKLTEEERLAEIAKWTAWLGFNK